jgi:hypothetical protein
MTTTPLQFYEAELSDYATNTLDKIKERGYWKVVIRPSSSYSSQRIALAELADVLQTCVVNTDNLGKYFPPVYPNQPPPTLRQNWLGQEHSLPQIPDITDWRLYTSGQFACYFSMREDWISQPSSSGFLIPKELKFTFTKFHFLEVFTFARSLVGNTKYYPLTPNETLEITIQAHGTHKRQLNMNSGGIPLYLHQSLP